MSNQSLMTGAHAFFNCSPDVKLFDVRAAVPTDEALETASVFLSSARSLAYLVASECDDDKAFALAHLIEMAKGIVDASILGLPNAGGAA